MTPEEAQAFVKKCGSIRKAAVAAGVSRRTMGRIVHGELKKPCKLTRHLSPSASAPSYAGASAAVRSVADFRNVYDLNTIVPKKIAAGFKLLGAGWMYESEFAKAAGLTLKDLGNFRENYMDHFLVTRDGHKVWAGRVSVANELRQMI
jgi:hypothetical protein